MDVGSTGTRKGMNLAQATAFEVVIIGLAPTVFRGGDCVGADKQMMEFVRRALPACKLVGHLPTIGSHRAYFDGYHEVRPARPYHVRNRDIVDECRVLIGCPASLDRQLYGGTHYTIDYARKVGRRVIVIAPDGTISDSGVRA